MVPVCFSCMSSLRPMLFAILSSFLKRSWRAFENRVSFCCWKTFSNSFFLSCVRMIHPPIPKVIPNSRIVIEYASV